MSPRGRPVSMPPSLSASGPISVTPRSSHPTDSSRQPRARSASGLMCTREPLPSGCLRQLSSTLLDESVPTRAQRVDLWATPAHVRHGFHRRPVAAAHSPCLSRPPSECGPTAAACDAGKEDPRPWTHTTRLGQPAPTSPARRHRPRAHSAPRADPGRSQRRLPPGLPGPAVPVPAAPLAAGPPISPPSSAAPRGPPP